MGKIFVVEGNEFSSVVSMKLWFLMNPDVKNAYKAVETKDYSLMNFINDEFSYLEFMKDGLIQGYTKSVTIIGKEVTLK